MTHHDNPGQPKQVSVITHADMGHCIATGVARPLSKLVTNHARMDGSWWLRGNDGWLKITDDAYIADLQAASIRMQALDLATAAGKDR